VSRAARERGVRRDARQQRKPVNEELVDGVVRKCVDHYIRVIERASKMGVTLVFSGDLGNRYSPLLRDPEKVGRADVLLLESTYGDRSHPKDNLNAELAVALKRVAARGGVAVVPVFAAPLGTLSTRVRAFMDWVRRQVTSHDLFIADGQGNPVTDRGATVELVTAALLMAEAARKALRHFASADEGGGGVVLDLPDERKLCVIGADTTHGVFCLGLVLDDALAPRVAQRFRQALKKAIESDEPRRERW
jgi:hypothetical protein